MGNSLFMIAMVLSFFSFLPLSYSSNFVAMQPFIVLNYNLLNSCINFDNSKEGGLALAARSDSFFLRWIAIGNENSNHVIFHNQGAGMNLNVVERELTMTAPLEAPSGQWWEIISASTRTNAFFLIKNVETGDYLYGIDNVTFPILGMPLALDNPAAGAWWQFTYL